MYTIAGQLAAELQELRDEGLYKVEVPLSSPQAAHVEVEGRRVVNLCANNYLGLADDPRLVAAASEALARWGLGMASVRFICGTQEPHTELERRLTGFLHPGATVPGEWDTILYSSCFDANGGLFECLFDERDAIISDELNHASIIDGVRLSKARRLRYRNRDMADLERQLRDAQGSRRIVVATDGVFSMDGVLAPLDEVCALAERHGALVMVDDSHAVGVVGEQGRGTPEHFGVAERVDILTGTFGKALGGASGGYTCARREVVEVLRQRSRPYLFSNSLAPSIVAATLAALELLEGSGELRQRLRENTAWFRRALAENGFEVPEGEHPIVPVMVGDAATAARMADLVLAQGVYVRAFSHPVVPRGRARIRTQMSATLTREDLTAALAAFVRARDAVESGH